MIHEYRPHIFGVLINRWCEVEPTYAAERSVIRGPQQLPLHPHMTFFIGENGSGNSTLLEAIAVADGSTRRAAHGTSTSSRETLTATFTSGSA